MGDSRRPGPGLDGRHFGSRGRGGFCPRFFLDDEPRRLREPGADAAIGDHIVLGAEDSRHALQVLRMRKGERCEVVTPSGRVYSAAVSTETEPVHVMPLVLLEGAAAGAAYRVQVGVVQALARASVMDYAIEKATEVGAGFFLVVSAAGSPRLPEGAKTAKLARWRRIAREAAKQSKQTAVPWVEEAASVSDGLGRLGASGALVVVLEPGAPVDLPGALRAALARPDSTRGRSTGGALPTVSLWVGPEGGWSDTELALLLARGAVTARLGRGILRAETAGPVGVAVARLELGDW